MQAPLPVDFVLPISFTKGLTADIGESKAHALDGLSY
jgi:hypothetical protein